MRRVRLVAFVAAGLGLGLAVGPAPAPAQETGNACTKDIERLCPDMKPGRRLQKCIQEKQPEFSPECKSLMEERENRRKLFQESCADDIRTFCSNTQAGQGRIRRCLLGRGDQVSPECRSAMQQIPESP
jgi:hypothetical protein